MSARPFRVLFLCTGNSARSILAEALLDRLGRPAYRGFSAGSQPKAAPHPAALELLARKGFDIRRLRSKSWDEFAAPEALEIDLVITVCDNAASESCPVWPGQPITVHWSHPDPATHVGSESEIRAAFESVYGQLRAKIEKLVDLDPIRPGGDAFKKAVRDLGSIGSTVDRAQ